MVNICKVLMIILCHYINYYGKIDTYTIAYDIHNKLYSCIHIYCDFRLRIIELYLTPIQI